MKSMVYFINGITHFIKTEEIPDCHFPRYIQLEFLVDAVFRLPLPPSQYWDDIKNNLSMKTYVEWTLFELIEVLISFTHYTLSNNTFIAVLSSFVCFFYINDKYKPEYSIVNLRNNDMWGLLVYFDKRIASKGSLLKKYFVPPAMYYYNYIITESEINKIKKDDVVSYNYNNDSNGLLYLSSMLVNSNILKRAAIQIPSYLEK
eukprot:GHVR01038579.1.p1 GENE.GHVR01038579.1~~GHVR01038579.1.p1  ORF type:complete len:203 (+),score=33.64 GHVR01038579.1:296-904(+)